MKYLENIQKEIYHQLNWFIKNEPEDTDEYALMLKLKQEVDSFIARNKFDFQRK